VTCSDARLLAAGMTLVAVLLGTCSLLAIYYWVQALRMVNTALERAWAAEARALELLRRQGPPAKPPTAL
jgi:hypothetical protein